MTTEKPQRIIGALVLAAAAVLLITTGARLSLGLLYNHCRKIWAWALLPSALRWRSAN